MKSDAAVQTGVYVQETMKSPAFQGFQILHWGFVIAPILAGLDKFFMKLTDWTQYLWAPLGSLVGTPRQFMYLVGAIEIIAGFLVAFKPKIGGFVVAFWLWGIIVNLLLLLGSGVKFDDVHEKWPKSPILIENSAAVGKFSCRLFQLASDFSLWMRCRIFSVQPSTVRE